MSGPLVMMVSAAMLQWSSSPPTLAMMMVDQLVERVIKRSTVPVGKGKTGLMIASSLLAELTMALVKVNVGWVAALLPECYPDMELLVKQFCSN